MSDSKTGIQKPDLSNIEKHWQQLLHVSVLCQSFKKRAWLKMSGTFLIDTRKIPIFQYFCDGSDI